MQRLHRILAELKRRHVYRVAGGYIVAAWLIIQVAATALPYLHAPEWLITTIIVVALAGFPVALILAWLFEVTPTGVHRETDAAHAPPLPPRPTPTEATPTAGGGVRIRPRWERLGPVLAGVAAVAIGGWLWSARAERGGPASPFPFTGFDAITLEHLQDSIQRQIQPLIEQAERNRLEGTGAGSPVDVPVPPPPPGTSVAPQTAGTAAVADSIAAGRYHSISVLPFTPIGDAGLWQTAQQLTVELRRLVERRSPLTAVSAARVAEAISDADLPSKAGVDAAQARKLEPEALGDAYIVGHLIYGGGTVVDAELRSSRDHALLRSTKIVGASADPIPLARTVADELLGHAN